MSRSLKVLVRSKKIQPDWNFYYDKEYSWLAVRLDEHSLAWIILNNELKTGTLEKENIRETIEESLVH